MRFGPYFHLHKRVKAEIEDLGKEKHANSLQTIRKVVILLETSVLQAQRCATVRFSRGALVLFS